MYALRFSMAAIKALKKAPDDVAGRIRSRLDELAKDPFAAPGVKKLTGHPGYRLRVGDWRVLYLIEKGELVIHVVEIGQRKEVSR
ncbi:type II toxin-antitoxin system RelE family toxin [Desulfolutivibrio sulfoxidireducens]|uniref:type II toxin-antitoxin system RelE family toxin n=1 Tax=Desulfolutivibrio sulfoxidireducens TaxID=2773299 RepID=UPI00159DF7DE|nr:type II toxin-antitoxin system RelE/ParE family toxin [Desulfolutivibrio sulfoxidireducens]QLA17527.1 type II toxin-antitoxin system RelE/ParE family toxin [Desulfolutivibrio sulfoxidireducens]